MILNFKKEVFMKWVDINVFKVAETKLNRDEVRAWMDRIGATEFEVPSEEVASDPEVLVGMAAKRCYNSFQVGLNPNVTKIRQDWAEYLDNVLKMGHGSVIEHGSFTFAIEGLSRVCTAELNRHRAGVAISEASLRYIRFDNDIPMFLPPSLKDTGTDSQALWDKKKATKDIMTEVVNQIQDGYCRLVKLWDFDNMKDFHQKKVITSLLRRIIPLGVAVGAVYTFNIRTLRHIITMRCSDGAEEEICYMVGKIAKEMFASCPKIFGDFVEENGFWRPKYVKV